MSWKDKVDKPFIIQTGDKKQYTPLWSNPTKAIEYNVAEFDFPNLSGSLVNRGRPRGRRFDLEFYFQGDDHLDTAEAFEVSARDQRPWIIFHPYYGNLTVHPFGMVFDNTKHNITRISSMVVETMTGINPRTIFSPVDNIMLAKAGLDNSFMRNLDYIPTIKDQNQSVDTINKFYKLGKKITSIAEESEKYFNLFNTANSAILSATAAPLAAVRAIQAAIAAPSLFKASVRDRMGLFEDQFSILRKTFSTITNRSSKKMYENIGSGVISGMAMAAASPQPGDYANRPDVLAAIEALLKAYNQYFGNLYSYSDLDNLQTDNGGSPESYIPDADAMAKLSALVHLVISNLFQIALNSRQERTVYLEDDTNLITITHRFYGLDPFDNNMTEMMNNNNIGLNEILGVKKGRKITYYV